MTPEQIVNTDQYPIVDVATERTKSFIAHCRETYESTGLCALPGFIKADALPLLVEEANAVRDDAWFCNNTHNAYLNTEDLSLPSEHINRRQEKTYVGSIPYDRIGRDSHLNRLYCWDPLMHFVAAVLGKRSLYRFADPLGACSINVFVDGGAHGWHFDESEFTITLMLQAPEQGGAFEYAPLIRGHIEEERIVESVLNNDYEDVVELAFVPGTLLIFGGRQTIHRVTRVAGNTPRLVPVLCYSELPDQKNSDHVRQLFWGRTT